MSMNFCLSGLAFHSSGQLSSATQSCLKKMATHSSILAWRIPWTKEPGGLQSMGSQRVGHNWATNTHTHTHTEYSIVCVYHIFFICWWTHRLFPCPGCCKQCCKEHWSGCVFDHGFLRVCAQQWDSGVIWQLCFYFCNEPAYCSP